MQFHFTTLLVAFFGLISLVSACLRVDMVYDNDSKRVAWFTAHDNGVLVMTKGTGKFIRDGNVYVDLDAQVTGWSGMLLNNIHQGFIVRFETPAGVTTQFGLAKRCTAEGGPNGCRMYWMDGRKWC